MTEEFEKQRQGIRWGIPASILLHVIFAAVLLVQLPLNATEPAEEESIQIEIVSLPEPEPAPEPEAEQEEQPSPPEEEQEEAAQPPEPDEPPPSEEQNEASAEQENGQPLPVLRPVFEFGEENRGPRISETGNASVEAEAPPDETQPETDTPVPPETADEAPTPDSTEPPQLAEAEEASQPDILAAAPVPDESQTAIAPALPDDTSESEPSDTAEAEQPTGLTEAKTLFSQNETDDLVAMTAMDDVSRGVRAGQLCATELREQLRHASPLYRPEILPAYRLSSGTVLEVSRAAFRADAQWYDISFRCEIDQNATRVLSFAFDVGDPIPRGEWQSRGFPAY